MNQRFSREYFTFQGLKYFQSDSVSLGKKPEIIFTSGIHGDEQSVIPKLFLLWQKYQEELPPSLFIPVLSQFACAAGTRENLEGEDFNRIFNRSPLPREASRARRIMELVSGARLLVSVHQDSSLSRKNYIYSEGKQIARKALNRWRRGVFTAGGTTLSNLDDREDPSLGMLARDGYIFHGNSKRTPEMFESMAVNHEFVEQAITIEVPTKATDKAQTDYLESMMSMILLCDIGDI